MRKAARLSGGWSCMNGRLTRRELMALIGSGAVFAVGEIPVFSSSANAATIRTATTWSRARRSGPLSIAAATQFDHMKLVSLQLGQIELKRSVLPLTRSNDGPELRIAGTRQPEHQLGSRFVSEAEKNIGEIYTGTLRAALQAHATSLITAAVIVRSPIFKSFLEKTENFRDVLDKLSKILEAEELGKGDVEPASGRSVEKVRQSEELLQETRSRKRERDDKDRKIERLRQYPLGERNQESQSGETRGKGVAGEREPLPHFRVSHY